uniref:Ras-related protein RHN1-like n=1 Tax=Rhizophora mucronata TaxID=61149 RepID=A0A2P2KZJ2_RHIMU
MVWHIATITHYLWFSFTKIVDAIASGSSSVYVFRLLKNLLSANIAHKRQLWSQSLYSFEFYIHCANTVCKCYRVFQKEATIYIHQTLHCSLTKAA